MTLFFGGKESLLIELSLEPWLLESIKTAPIDIQINRMHINKFNEVLDYAKKTSFAEQYLWGLERWYLMKEKGHPEYFDRAKEILGK